MSLPDSSILTNIQVWGHARPLDLLFEKVYIQTRGLENRLYTDEEVWRLPDISIDHTHYQEWQIRRRTARRLIRYLSRKHEGPEILDVGCGNGWLSHLMAEMPGATVTGIDINFTELQQAARVFNDDPNLTFIRGDIRSGLLGDRKFDYIIFADSIQYFSSLKKTLHLSLSLLKKGGEIHITDTFFYRRKEIEQAKRGAEAYYSSLGYPEMADFYFHQTMDDLRSFHHSLLYNPTALSSRLLGRKDQFPWIRVKN